MKTTREQLLMKLGAARAKAPVGWRLVDVKVEKASAAFTFTLNRDKLRKVRRREGRYLLRTNLTESDPATLWQYYIQLVAVEEAFKNLKSLPSRRRGPTSPSDPSFIKKNAGSRPISSSPSWPIAYTSRCSAACTPWRRA
jgi:hypothetical protein